MQASTISALLYINHQFYQTFGHAFAATRRRIQPGIRRVLASLPPDGDWLDLGCGSGALARVWAELGRRGSYTGLDFSPPLLDEARLAVKDIHAPGLALRFGWADLSDPDWPACLKDLFPPFGSVSPFAGVLSFAVLHHIPSAEVRRRILRDIHGLLAPGGLFIHSEWQFQHSKKLMARVQPWEAAGLSAADVEEGDTLLDWRYTLPNEPDQVGLRYVHLFSREELATLAGDTGFDILETFESDGEGGRLGLYQTWRAR